MGVLIFDQYSILHFSIGVIAYFWSIPFFTIILLHIIFEYIENTKIGMKIINTYFTFWPGGKPYSDNLLNSISDTIFTGLGWIVSYNLDMRF